LRIAPKTVTFTFVLGLFAALPALSIDVSAPTLPLLPEALDTSRALASLTLSLFMVGFAAGQLGGGGLSDRHGRRPVLLSGLAGFALAGIACALSFSGGALVFFRFIQGACAGMCSVISFAMVQDLFEGDEARAKRSFVTMIFGAVPILAPALGSMLTVRFGWRATHWTLALMGGLLFMITWVGIAESKTGDSSAAVPSERHHTVRLRDDKRFVYLTLANALSYGCIFAYIAGSPVIIIGQMGLSSAIFAGLFACTASALAAGAWTSGKLSRGGVGAIALLDACLLTSSVAALALAVASLSVTSAGWIEVPLLLVVMFARGIIAPNLQHLAIERHPERAGLASATVGVAQLLLGALASATVALLLPIGTGAVAFPMALLSTAALISWRWDRRTRL
jgi:MFS transporter, DHA1 family, multidrug resistance protein